MSDLIDVYCSELDRRGFKGRGVSTSDEVYKRLADRALPLMKGRDFLVYRYAWGDEEYTRDDVEGGK